MRLIQKRLRSSHLKVFLKKGVFFSIWVFFHEHSRFTGQQGKGKGIYLTPLYHFHPLHRHLDISRAITAESSLLHIAGSRTPLVSERKLLTTTCSENMQQIYWRTPMPKCDLNRVTLQLYWNHTLAFVFSCKFAAYFQNTVS